MNEYIDTSTRQGDDAHIIKEVLAGFTPLGEDHPVAQQTKEAVAEMLSHRTEVPLRVTEYESIVESTRLTGTVIRPGDTLLLSTTDPVTRETAEALKARVEEELPGVRAVILSKLHVEGVYRVEED